MRNCSLMAFKQRKRVREKNRERNEIINVIKNNTWIMDFLFFHILYLRTQNMQIDIFLFTTFFFSFFLFFWNIFDWFLYLFYTISRTEKWTNRKQKKIGTKIYIFWFYFDVFCVKISSLNNLVVFSGGLREKLIFCCFLFIHQVKIKVKCSVRCKHDIGNFFFIFCSSLR